MTQDPAQPPARDEARGDEQAAGGLSHEMHALSGMIRDLEDQLDQMVASNDALKKDLDEERERRLALEQRLTDVREQLRRAEEDAAGKENLQAEVQLVNQERAKLNATIRELRQELAEERRRRDNDQSLVQRLRAARADALEDLQAVESQFERAMQKVADLQAQLTVATEERDALRGQLRVTEDKLERLEQERDYLAGEVEQSRTALDDIRRSLVDACMVSSGSDEAGTGTSTRG